MIEIGFILFVIAIIAALCYAMREAGASSARATEMQEEIEEVTKIMKEASDAAKIRKEAERLTRAGTIPNRLSKYQRD